MVKTSMRWIGKVSAWLLLLAGFVFAVVVLSLRYWLLPDIEQYRADIAASLSKIAGQQVTIGKISGNWQGLRPHLILGDVQLYDRNGHPALFFNHVENTLSWWSLFVGEIRLKSLLVERPSLVMRRDAQGLIYVAGIVVNRPSEQPGFADWILRQHQIVVRDATILWQDDMRQAPPLVLTRVNLRLENKGRRHDFGLHAIPPPQLAAPLDVRGELTGKTALDWPGWRGRLYARLDDSNFGAWHSWLPLPYDLQSGYGGARVWVDFNGGRLLGVSTDLRLRDVKARMAEALPQIDLQSLSGKLGWRRVERGEEFSAAKLSLALRQGVRVSPTDLTVRLLVAQGRRPAGGSIQANSLRLEPWLPLSVYLPLPQAARTRWAALAPRGGFSNFNLSWQGAWDAPQEYTARGRFIDLGIASQGKAPGLSGISGTLDATHKGGVLAINARNTGLSLPQVFPAPLTFAVLAAHLSWKIKDGQTTLNLASASFSNTHLAGNFHGNYHTVKDHPGVIDLTGNLTRAEAVHARNYIPFVVGQHARDWLDTAFLAGKSTNVKLRLKGDLKDFPFVDNKRGLFQVTAMVTGATLEYAKNWPKIENLDATLLFQGKRMEVIGKQGNILGAQLSKVRAVISDLLILEESLDVDGEAQGASATFLKFINDSPVNQMINGVSEGIQAQGTGHLALKLHIPLRHSKDTKVSGIYQFLNNQIDVGQGAPLLEQVNAKLAFSETAISMQNASAQILGGPASINAATQKDGTVRIAAQGKFTSAGISKSYPGSVSKALSGSTDWRGVIMMRQQLANLVIESSMQGIAIDLPAPFAKKAEEGIPLRVEKKELGNGQALISFNYGRNASGQFLRRTDGTQSRIERGAISLGGVASLPQQSGVWLSGALRYADLDQWRALLNKSDGDSGLMIQGVNLNFASLDIFGKRFTDVSVNAWTQAETWKATLRGNEMDGEVVWKPTPEAAGKSPAEPSGKLTARFKSLTIPGSTPAKQNTIPAKLQGRDFPSIDLVADNFQIKQSKLGKLELIALPQAASWRIEKLHITNSDSTLQADGVWMWDPAITRINLRLDSSDAGKLLARFDYPGYVKNGTVKLEGELSWPGGLADMDYAVLTGNFSLVARNGQFMKADPGIGKLLGILSLQALPRRITLDFQDVFSSGFAFDDISGSMRIIKGVMSSDDFKMQGPAARVAMSGETDLGRETQKLRVRITPLIGDSVALAGAFLGGPVIGLTALVLQKMLKDPLGQIISYEYQVTGTWVDPVVAKGGNRAATLE